MRESPGAVTQRLQCVQRVTAFPVKVGLWLAALVELRALRARRARPDWLAGLLFQMVRDAALA